MSDGEQAKGQISEAMRVARKYELSNLTVIIDYNQIQISGNLHEVMPQHIKETYQANGWEVVEIDGHDIRAVYKALRHGVTSPGNVCVLANTVIGKGVSFMEGKHVYHGKALTEEECAEALEELGIGNDLEALRKKRESAKVPQDVLPLPEIALDVDTGTPRTYAADEKTDNRSAFGNALQDLAEGNKGKTPIVAVDCDLATSVKTTGLEKVTPEAFLQTGVQEHNAATLTGALSVSGVVPFFADFGVFGVDETYNQHRLNDINHTNVKLVCTHNGLDVGEDGKTHQCIDYVGALSNLFGYKVIVPADPNQTDRAVRCAAGTVGNFLIAAGRSKLPVITGENGEPLFGGDYEFRYGAADVVREGADAAILTAGGMTYRALAAWEKLKEQGITCLLLNVSCPLDLDADAMKRAAATGGIVTYEDHHARTGLGSLVANFLAEHGLSAKLRMLGVRSYGRSGVPDDLFAEQGLDPDSLVEAVKAL
jgi:transketolase